MDPRPILSPGVDSLLPDGHGSRSPSVSSFCEPSEEGGLPSACRHVLHELIDTERGYVEALKEVMEGYVGPMMNQDHLPILAEDRRALFGNTEDLCHFSQQLAHEFDEAGHDMQALAACFHRNEEGFKKYTEYCNNYPRAVEVLASAQRLPMMAEFFKGCQLALGHMLPLGAYLLKPVQRILKYHLLLADLLKQYGKHVQKDDEAHQELTAARNTMAGVAEYINAMKRKHEVSVRSQEIISQVAGWDTKVPVGLLILDDNFRVQGARDRRIIYLFEKVMLVTKKNKDGLMVYKGHISYSNMTILEHLKDPLNWEVSANSNKGLQLIIIAKNAQQKQKWVTELRRLIIANDKNLPEEVKMRMLLHQGKENITLTNPPQKNKTNSSPSTSAAPPSPRTTGSGVELFSEQSAPPDNETTEELSPPATFDGEEGGHTPVRVRRGLQKISRNALEHAREALRRTEMESAGESLKGSLCSTCPEMPAPVSETDGAKEVSPEAKDSVNVADGRAAVDVGEPSPVPDEAGSASVESLLGRPSVSKQASIEETQAGEGPIAERPMSTEAFTTNMDNSVADDESDDEVSELIVEEPEKQRDISQEIVDAPDIMVPESHIKEFNLLPRDRFGVASTSPGSSTRSSSRTSSFSNTGRPLRRSRTYSPGLSPEMTNLVSHTLRNLKQQARERLDKTAEDTAVSNPSAAAVDSKEMLERTRGLVQRLVKRYTELVTEEEVKSESGSATPTAMTKTQTHKKLPATKPCQRMCPSQRAAVNVKRSRSLCRQTTLYPLRRHGSVTAIGLHNAGVTYVTRATPAVDKRARRSMYQVFAELRRDGRRIQVKTRAVRPRNEYVPPAGRVRRLIERFSVQPM